MGRTQNFCCQWRWRHVIISMLLLVGSKLFPTEGRVLSDVMIEAETAELWRDGVFEGGRVETVKKRRLIGSSPPRCERRCSSSCGRCQAVQVPVVSQQQRPRWISRLFAADATPGIAYSRGGGGDGVSNYKPMAWKCKCGDLLFNP